MLKVLERLQTGFSCSCRKELPLPGKKAVRVALLEKSQRAPDPVQAVSPLTVPAGGVYRGPVGQESPAQRHRAADRPA